MIRLLWALLVVSILPAAAQAERVVAALSRNQVQIDTAFTGSEILIYGAVKRSAPAPRDSVLGVIVTVTGPEEPVMVRRKERVLGIWANTASVEIDRAPAFYAVAASAPLAQVLDQTEDERFAISAGRALQGVMATEGLDPGPFSEALIRIRERAGAFQTVDSRVTLIDDTLFSTEIALPANLVEGAYRIQIFLTRDGEVQTRYRTGIAVNKVGLERFLYRMAHERAFLYGLMSVAIAIAAGWLASSVFRALGRG